LIIPCGLQGSSLPHMSSFKKIDKATEVYRQQIREKYYPRYLQEVERKKKEGKFPFEGKWGTVGEILKLQRELKKKDRIIFCEILFLYLFSGIITWGLYWLLTSFLLPR